MTALPTLRTPIRLTNRLAIGLAIVLMLAGVAMALFNEHQVRSQGLRESVVQADILAGSVAGALAFDDRETAQSYVNAMRADRQIEAVGVYDIQGRLVAGFAKAGVLPAANRLVPPAIEGLDLIVTVPVVEGTSRFGSVYLRAVTEPITRRVVRYAVVGSLILMASLIVAALGASNASLSDAHSELELEMAERARTEEALRRSQQAEADIRLAIEAERGRTALRQSEQQLELALRAGRLGNWALDLPSGRLIASEFLRANFGLGPDEPFDRYGQLLARVHPDDRNRLEDEMDAAIAGRADLESEFRTVSPDGETRWILMRGRAAHDGGTPRMTGVSLDITERKKADERQRLLLDELNHRVKNTLASVQSIALQTSRRGDVAGFKEAFLSRIEALSQAHDLLTSVAWEGALLQEVIVRSLAPYVADQPDGRVRLTGPRVRLGPNAAVSLTMAFHELATNAGKYGSLSVPTGRVDVVWGVDTPAKPTMIEIEWRESGGPEVSPPTRRGFGSRLVQQGLAREFDGQVELVFARDGVRCLMRLPLSQKMQLAA